MIIKTTSWDHIRRAYIFLILCVKQSVAMCVWGHFLKPVQFHTASPILKLFGRKTPIDYVSVLAIFVWFALLRSMFLASPS